MYLGRANMILKRGIKTRGNSKTWLVFRDRNWRKGYFVWRQLCSCIFRLYSIIFEKCFVNAEKYCM